MNSNQADVARALPDHDVEAEIGRGQFGVVWRARHRQLRRLAAVKQFALPSSDEHAARFRREARILAQLDHPHVVRVFDYREAEGQRLLVMELLTGGTLADRMAAGLDARGAVAATIAAAMGLSEVHRHGVLHRDVKPENLMFDGRDVLKVTDFGIAREHPTDGTAVHLTAAGRLFGTPAYVSPEQAGHALGEGWDPLDATADEYSLAAVLYEALSGELTHDASGGAVALCSRRMTEDARPLAEVAPTVASPLADVVMRALSLRSSDRYATCDDFAVALAEAGTAAFGAGWLDDSDVVVAASGTVARAAAGATAARSAPPTVPTGRSQRSLGRKLTFAAVGLVLALVAGTAIALRPSDDERADGSSSSTTVPAATVPAKLTSRWRFETGGEVLSSPAVADGLVVIGSSDNKVYALNASDGKRRWVRPTGNAVRSSPAIADGKAYIGSDEGAVYAFDLATGDVAWQALVPREVPSSPVVAGDTVVVGSDQIYAFDAGTGAVRWKSATAGAVASSPAISDGVVVVGSDDAQVHAVDLADGHERWHRATGDKVQSSPTVVDGVAYVGSNDGHLYAISVATGEVVWGPDLLAPIRSSPVVADGRAYVGTVGGRLVAVDLDTGKVVWTLDLHDGVASSPVVDGGRVIVGGYDGDVHVVQAARGIEEATFHTGGAVLSSPAVAGDLVVVGSNDGYVYGIDLGR